MTKCKSKIAEQQPCESSCLYPAIQAALKGLDIEKFFKAAMPQLPLHVLQEVTDKKLSVYQPIAAAEKPIDYCYNGALLAQDCTGRQWPVSVLKLSLDDLHEDVFCLFIADPGLQQLSELRISENDEKFKSIVLNSSNIIGIYNEQGHCQFISPTIKPILGYDPEYFYQNSPYSLIHPDDYDKVVRRFQEFDKSMTQSTVPYRYKHNNGEWRWMESYVTNLLDDPVIKGLVINSRDITERVELQQKLEEKNRQRQQEITAAVLKAQERERSHIGQELHDNINQILTTVKLYNEMILDGIGNTKEILAKSVHYLQTCIDEIRGLSKALSAPTLGHISLQDSVKELVDTINLTGRIKVVFTISGNGNEAISQDVHVCIYRILQEQLSNIIRYAEATQAWISIFRSQPLLTFTIEDNGKGFDMKEKSKGIGLTNMRTRAEYMGGTFTLWSEPGKGCRISVTIPLT